MESQSINLGRCKNKYLIIEILLYASEIDGIQEGELLLWTSSRRHRQFLQKNRSWYLTILKYKPVWHSLKKQSKELETID